MQDRTRGKATTKIDVSIVRKQRYENRLALGSLAGRIESDRSFDAVYPIIIPKLVSIIAIPLLSENACTVYRKQIFIVVNKGQLKV